MNKISNSRFLFKLGNLTAIVPQDNPYFCPLDCPLCETTISDSEDAKSYIEWNTCRQCFVSWVESRKDSWLEGLRPSIDQIENYQKQTKTIPTLSVSFSKYNY